MTKEIRIDLAYEAYNSVYVDLPEGKSAADIANITVEYDEGEIEFTDGSVLKFDGANDNVGLDNSFERPLYVVGDGVYEKGSSHSELLDLVRDLRTLVWEMEESTGYKADEEGKEVLERANKAIDPNWKAENEALGGETQEK